MLLFMAATGMSQTRWKRTEPEPTALQRLHSMHVASLPTTETLKKGNRLFEASHRFSTPINESGHFFKVVITNNDKINTSQFIAGVNNDFYQGTVRFGFMIQRTF